jgi:SAM-dependent methyltransferase
MKSVRHWTPGYITNRIALFCYQKLHPDAPWLTPAANTILESLLSESDVGLEFGSGRSTAWFAKRIKHLTSIEHNELWYERVQRTLKGGGHRNVDYRLCPVTADADGEHDQDYVRNVDDFADNSFDVVLVDGVCRGHCVLGSLRVVRPGGFLIIDNVNWFLPSNSYSPNSRSFPQGPRNEIWKRVHHSIANWRKIWTTSGVDDTAFFFKPHESDRSVQSLRSA